MKCNIGPVELGYVIGPWIKVGRYEVGSGTYTETKWEGILYSDDEDVEQMARFEHSPKPVRGFKFFGQQDAADGTSWTVSFNGRTLYFLIRKSST